MTNKELNAAIKATLKAAGYNVRDFRVSVRDSGYSTTARVYVKSPLVRPSEVERLLKQYAVVRWDEHVGEILAGGNTYLFVAYADDAFDDIPPAYLSQSAHILAHMTQNNGQVIYINSGRRISILADDMPYREGHRYRLMEWGDTGSQVTIFGHTAWNSAKAMYRLAHLGTIAA